MNSFFKKYRSLPLVFLVAGFFIFLIAPGIAGIKNESDPEDTVKGIENNVFSEENENCFQCHGERYYAIKDSLFGTVKNSEMCLSNRIERDEFYHSVHWSFSCYDCHSEEYNEFPHPLGVRFEEYWTCLDCHGFDENFAQYQFEAIDEQHTLSVHYTATGGNFSCWECHDPHTYRLLTREVENMETLIVETNNTCLECHGNEERFKLLSERELGNVVPQHDWLPNQSLHFKAVRCIECHSEMNDTVLVSHNILPAKNAVRNCVDCHSQNSILMGTLYKFKAQEERKQSGFVNGVIIQNDAYVIGANRSRFLNILSLAIFGLALAAMAVHIVFRIKSSKKNES